MGTAIESRIQQRIQLCDREIADFCQRWGIREMALFGSVLREDFRADSDIAIPIEFETNALTGINNPRENQTGIRESIKSTRGCCRSSLY